MTSFTSYQRSMLDGLANKSSEELVVMLCDRMITKIKQSKERLQAGQKKEFWEANLRAMKIATALMDNLNLESGGEVAQNLEKLYGFIVLELGKANRFEDSLTHLGNALSIVETLQSSWRKLAERSQ